MHYAAALDRRGEGGMYVYVNLYCQHFHQQRMYQPHIYSRVVLTLGLPRLLIYLSLGYAWRVFAFVFLFLFYFFPSPPIRSGEAFSSVIFSSLFFYLFFWM